MDGFQWKEIYIEHMSMWLGCWEAGTEHTALPRTDGGSIQSRSAIRVWPAEAITLYRPRSRSVAGEVIGATRWARCSPQARHGTPTQHSAVKGGVYGRSLTDDVIPAAPDGDYAA